MNKLSALITASFLSVLITQTGLACPTDKSLACHCGNTPKDFTALHLTHEQRNEVKAIKTKYHNAAKTNHQNLKSIKEQLNSLITTNKLDEATLDSLISQKTKLSAAILKNHIMMQQQVYTVLDNSQKAQFKQMYYAQTPKVQEHTHH